MSGPIRISVLADTKDMRRDLGSAERSLRDMGDTAEKAARDVDKSMSGVGDAVDGTASNASTLAGAFGDVAGGLGLIGLGGFSDELESLAPALMLTAGAADIASVAMNTLSISKIKDTAATIANKTASIASSAATKAQAAAQWALNAAMSANPIMLVVIAIAALVAGIVIAYKKSETFRAIVTGAFNALMSVVRPVVNFFKAAIPAAFSVMVKIVTTYVNTYKQVVTSVFNAVKTVVTTGVNAIVTGVKSIPGSIKGLGKLFLSAGKALMDKIFEGFKAVGSIGADIGTNLFNGVINGINTAIRGVNDFLPDKIKLKGLPDINLPNNPIPEIPALARGGITNGPTVAMIGDNPGGREAVIPLDRYDLGGGRMVEVLEKILDALIGSQEATGRAIARESGRGWTEAANARRAAAAGGIPFR